MKTKRITNSWYLGPNELVVRLYYTPAAIMRPGFLTSRSSGRRSGRLASSPPVRNQTVSTILSYNRCQAGVVTGFDRE